MPDTFPTSGANTRMGSNSGQPMTRRDGLAKVTGTATYAADNRPEGVLHAVYAMSSEARGQVTSLNVAAALAHPGVVHVMTPENRPPLARDPDSKPGGMALRTEALQDNSVRYVGQPIALVVAQTLEAATEGAALLRPTYAVEPARIGFDGGEAFETDSTGFGSPPTVNVGDIEAGRAAGMHHFEATYETPLQYHNAMEPHAIVAEWDGDHLTIDTPNQAIVMARGAFADYFDIPAENVVLRSPYLGGGFGSKALPIGPQLLTILAARELQRPVKLALRRDQMFGPVMHRGATRQRLRLDMGETGQLTAIDHHTTATTSSFDTFIEGASAASRNTYASPAIATSHSGVRVDTGTPGAMRAPGEATGSAALECAVDEAAEVMGLDPLEFRLRNYAETDPQTGKAFSSKALRECYALGAKSFGWENRPLAPRQMRDAQGHLVGWGMGTALFAAHMNKAEARAVLRADGSAMIATAGADMGQGAWTALAQIAADGLGLGIDQVEFRSGDSTLPNGGVAGGSGHTATAGSALFAAGEDVIRKLADLATEDPESPLFGAGNAGVVARDGRLHRADDDSRSQSYSEILRNAGVEELEGKGDGARDPGHAEARAMFSHGAVFAEVKVDPELGQVRVTRLIGAFAAGRIINPHLARSQLLGGMIWGLGFALMEEGIHDKRTGRPVNGDLAGYHVPVNADVPMVEALMVHEDDDFVNPLGVKGVGELGITGSVGAIANAVWHATGMRPRSFPIHLETLIG